MTDGKELVSGSDEGVVKCVSLLGITHFLEGNKHAVRLVLFLILFCLDECSVLPR